MTPPSPLDAALAQYFGFDGFRDGQREVVQALLDGHSAMAIFPTGSGKSLCYQLAATQLPHLTLVISPLLAALGADAARSACGPGAWRASMACGAGGAGAGAGEGGGGAVTLSFGRASKASTAADGAAMATAVGLGFSSFACGGVPLGQRVSHQR